MLCYANKNTIEGARQIFIHLGGHCTEAPRTSHGLTDLAWLTLDPWTALVFFFWLYFGLDYQLTLGDTIHSTGFVDCIRNRLLNSLRWLAKREGGTNISPTVKP